MYVFNVYSSRKDIFFFIMSSKFLLKVISFRQYFCTFVGKEQFFCVFYKR